MDSNNLPTLNDNLNNLNNNVIKTKNVLNDLFGNNDILGTENGGTGQDFSTAPQNSIPYFSSTGVMGNVEIGTSGLFLQSQGSSGPPIYAKTPAPLIAYTNNVQATVTGTGGNNVTTTVITNITTDGGWTGKNYLLFGELAGQNTSYPGLVTTSGSMTTGSSTAVIGSLGTGTTGSCLILSGGLCSRTISGYNAAPSIGYSGGDAGAASCTVQVSSGNLVLTASETTCGGNPQNCNPSPHCEFSGIVIREP